MKWRRRQSQALWKSGRIISRSQRLSPGGQCSVQDGQSWQRAHSCARLRLCLLSPLPLGFVLIPSLCSASLAQQGSGIKSSPSLAPSWCSKAWQEQCCGHPSAASSQGSSQSGAQLLVTQQSTAVPCQQGMELASPSQGSETCFCSPAWMGASLDQHKAGDTVFSTVLGQALHWGSSPASSKETEHRRPALLHVQHPEPYTDFAKCP